MAGGGAWVAVLDPAVAPDECAEIVAAAERSLPGARVTRGDGWALVPIGDGVRSIDAEPLRGFPSVRDLVEVTAPYRLASRAVFGADMSTGVVAGPDHPGAARVGFGGRESLAVVVSSRWAAASPSRFELLAPLLHEAGCRVFHAGQLARTNGDAPSEPSSEIGVATLHRLREIAHANGLALSVEVADASQIEAAASIADVLQVGSRNMQDFSLLREMGATTRPVLLRRGAGSTVEEFLLAAEYVLVHGNGRVILCESGIRTFDALHKPRFEINAVPLVKQLSHLPLIADPSQTAPHVATIPAMAKAAVAAGADGLVLEVGPEAVFDPDGVSIDIETMRRLMSELRAIARAVGRTVGPTESDAPAPADVPAVLRSTRHTLAQTIEMITGARPQLDVLDQWRLPPGVPWLSPPLSADGEILARCTSYRIGSVRLSRNLSYVDLGQIDPTLAALLEAEQLNLGQLFVDPRIEKLQFEFGTHEDAGEIDDVFRRCFRDEVEDLHPYLWRRYHAAIGGVVTFVVIEALPVPVWERVLRRGSLVAAEVLA